MMLNRVKEVSPMSDYRLAIVFRDGRRGVFDCRPYRDYPCLAHIWNEEVFSKVVADHGTVMWPNGADLCPDEVYDKTVMSDDNIERQKELLASETVHSLGAKVMAFES